MRVFVFLLCLASVVTALGVSSSGGGFTSFIKADFLAGDSGDSRLGGGGQPAGGAGTNTTIYCGRLGVFDSVKCLVSSVSPSGGVGDSGCPDDFRLVSNKVGLRRLNWLKRGVALNIGLPVE